jgi:hypothetical protein
MPMRHRHREKSIASSGGELIEADVHQRSWHKAARTS